MKDDMVTYSLMSEPKDAKDLDLAIAVVVKQYILTRKRKIAVIALARTMGQGRRDRKCNILNLREHLVAHWAVCNRLNMFIQKKTFRKKNTKLPYGCLSSDCLPGFDSCFSFTFRPIE